VQLKSEQLRAHLGAQLAPLYVVHGDEPLLSLEAQDAVRAAARAAGCAERVVLTVERGFDWSQLRFAGDSLSLFADRRLIELRIPGGKPGSDGAAALERYCEHLAAENVTIVSLPRLSKADQTSPWFEALSNRGVVVNVFPVERARLPQWIAARLAAQGQRADGDALEFLADAIEGNLLAAHQELQKLGLLYPAGALRMEQVQQAVLDVSRYDVYQAGEAMLAGDHRRALRILDSLRGEGEAAARIVWVLAEELRALAGVIEGMNAGRPAAIVLRECRVFGEPRQTTVTRAARRVAPERLVQAVKQAAACERLAKGVQHGDVWEELAQLVTAFPA
jgi:DNA polymerase-3 subunit delta